MRSKRAEEYIDENIYDAAECVDKDGCGFRKATAEEIVEYFTKREKQ